MQRPAPLHLPSFTVKALLLCPVSFTQFPLVTAKFGCGFQSPVNPDAYTEARGFKGIPEVSCFFF